MSSVISVVKSQSIFILVYLALLGGWGCRRDTPAPPNEAVFEGVTGRVVSQGDGVSGARVRFKGRKGHVVTDTSGRFRLSNDLADSSAELTVTAAKPGYLIAGTPVANKNEGDVEIELRPVPEGDNDDYEWIDPTPDGTTSLNCGNCHPAMYDQWKSGGHARGSANRHFLNLYAGTTWDESQQRGWGLLTEYPDGAGVCSSCHVPAAPIDDLGVTDIRAIGGVAAQGVHCDYCHKIRDVNVTAVGLTHGRFAVDLRRPHDDQVFFGPLDDVDRGEDSYLPLLGESKYCAVCHEGIVFGVPVYTTYSEWLVSPAADAGQSCQACHMQPDGETTNFAPDAGGIERDPMTLASHDLMPGGRETMLRDCVDVTTTCQSDDDGHRLTVQLAAHDMGHRVPTGFIDRHLILVVDVTNASGEPVDVTGARLPTAAGDFAGRPGVLLAKRLTDSEGHSPAPFWRAGTTMVDTRIDPRVPQTVEFHLPPDAARVRVRLVYRKFWYQTAQEKGWPDQTLDVVDQSWTMEELVRCRPARGDHRAAESDQRATER